MKEDLIQKFVWKLDYSYKYKTVNERQNIINELCEIAGIEQLTIPTVSGAVCACNISDSDRKNFERNLNECRICERIIKQTER